MDKNIAKGFLAGGAITIVSYNFLLAQEPYNMILFPFGLLIICVYGYNLFTGAVGFSSDYKYLAKMLLYNFAGCIVTGLILTASNGNVVEIADKVISGKYQNDLPALFLKGVFCGVCMYFAVKPWKNGKDVMVRVLSVFGFVGLFLAAKFEHGIADFGYLVLAKRFDVVPVLVVLSGNAIGAKFVKLLDDLIEN